MPKKISIEFKQQSVDYALSNAYSALTELANHLGIDKSTLDKWARQIASNKTNIDALKVEQ